MVSEILSNSWRLVWAEKRLMLIPLVGGIIALIIGCFAIVGGLGTDFVDNFSDQLNDQETVTEADISRAIDDTFAGFGSSQWILNLVLGLIAFFFQFATLTAVFRAFARQPYAVGAVISETWSRIGRVILFTLLIALLGAANTAITAILVSIMPGSLAALLSLALWVAYFVATFFLQPIAVAEDTGPIPAVTRSWELGRSVAPTLIGGGITLILLLIVYAIGPHHHHGHSLSHPRRHRPRLNRALGRRRGRRLPWSTSSPPRSWSPPSRPSSTSTPSPSSMATLPPHPMTFSTRTPSTNPKPDL